MNNQLPGHQQVRVKRVQVVNGRTLIVFKVVEPFLIVFISIYLVMIRVAVEQGRGMQIIIFLVVIKIVRIVVVYSIVT